MATSLTRRGRLLRGPSRAFRPRALPPAGMRQLFPGHSASSREVAEAGTHGRPRATPAALELMTDFRLPLFGKIPPSRHVCTPWNPGSMDSQPRLLISLVPWVLGLLSLRGLLHSGRTRKDPERSLATQRLICGWQQPRHRAVH